MNGGRSSADAGDIYDVVGPILFGPGQSREGNFMSLWYSDIGECRMEDGYYKIGINFRLIDVENYCDLAAKCIKYKEFKNMVIRL